MKAIVTADWHLRSDLPVCRIDPDWLNTQKQVVEFIAKQMELKKCDLNIVGDLFHRPIVHPKIFNMFLDSFYCLKYSEEISKVKTIAGNHCLPHHNYNNVNSSSYGILKSINHKEIYTMDEVDGYFYYGKPIKINKNKIICIHTLTFPDEKTKPKMVKAYTAQDLLDLFPNAEWIFTGDYHRSFHYENNGRHVVNPGCITIQAADMIDYQPKIAYVDTDKEIVEWINLPNFPEYITDGHLTKQKERNERIEAFAEMIKNKEEITLDFINNVHNYMLNNSLEKKTVDKINEFLEEQ